MEAVYERISRLEAAPSKVAAIQRILENWRSNDFHPDLGAPPSTEHYPHNYFWDSLFAGETAAYFEEPELAKMLLDAVFAGQRADGFIGNMHFAAGERMHDPERRYFTNPDFGSDYTQPPLLAHTVLMTYQSMLQQQEDTMVKNGQRTTTEEEARNYLAETYVKTRKYYDYLILNRQNEKLPTSPRGYLIGNIHPHETGLDSNKVTDRLTKPDRIPYEIVHPDVAGTPLSKRILSKLPRNMKALINTGLDYWDILRFTKKCSDVGWVTDEIRNFFWLDDVMFNSIYAQNLKYLADMADALAKMEEHPIRKGIYEKDRNFYQKLAENVEKGILEAMWNEEEKVFYCLTGTGNNLQQEKVLTISSLFPVILDAISLRSPDGFDGQLESILDLLQDPAKFNTKYPIPSLAVDDSDYDPEYREKRLWRGPSWVNTNWYIVTGLLKQRDRLEREYHSTNNDYKKALAYRCNDRARYIAEQTVKMVREGGESEFYGAESGEPKRVKNFLWDVLAYQLEDILQKGKFWEYNLIPRIV